MLKDLITAWERFLLDKGYNSDGFYEDSNIQRYASMSEFMKWLKQREEQQ